MQRSIILLVAFLLTMCANAQNTGITGTITDPTGLPIPGASIQIRNEGTNVVRETTTGETGTYNIPGLESGIYTIRVVKTGFQTLQRAGIQLFVATVTRLDLQLLVGNQAETVTVTGEAALL
ncbi:MAG: carboxypeptidase-like regulatory domain-containing protein, partial [Candidatus Solibacter sp.]|nr:carboxypeptidase-like regulatory domain-containing protein [Candidatus Solibacter sp.]